MTEGRVDDGLAGVVVAETALSEVDGEAGRLVIAGDEVEDLAGVVPFEEVTRRLLAGAGAAPTSEGALRDALGAARVAAFARPALREAATASRVGAAALRAALATLEAPDGGGPDPVRECVEVIAATGVAAALFAAAAAGRTALAPDPALDHATDLLRMARSAPPTEAEGRALDGYLVTVSDHGLNASTFTARVVASTGSDLVSAVVAAIGALKGPLHGGAPGPVLDMLEAVGDPSRAPAWVSAALARGERVMGMGHRIYRARDPRAVVLERLARGIDREAPRVELQLARASAVERAAEAALSAKKPERPLRANVELFTAVLLDALGLPREAMTPFFAAGRVAGWCAHVIEQRRKGRLVRPASRYVGARPAARP